MAYELTLARPMKRPCSTLFGLWTDPCSTHEKTLLDFIWLMNRPLLDPCKDRARLYLAYELTLARPMKRPCSTLFALWTDPCSTHVKTVPDRNQGIGQSEVWALARQNRPKAWYWPDRKDRNQGIGQTEQTEIWVSARPKLPLARRKARPNFFQTIGGSRTGPPCPRPKSVWPIPVLGRGLHPWYYSCTTIFGVLNVFCTLFCMYMYTNGNVCASSTKIWIKKYWDWRPMNYHYQTTR